MIKSIEEIAEELRIAHAEHRSLPAIGALLAHTVEIHHHPAMEMDGEMEGAAMAAELGTDHLAQAAPVLQRELESMAVDGDRIEVMTRIVGSLPDGTPVDVPFRMLCTVADGKVTGLDSYPDVERPALMELLMSARDAAAETTGVTVPGPGRESS